MRSKWSPIELLAWSRFSKEYQPQWSSTCRPGSSGCDLCKKIGDLMLGLPLVILSASSSVSDKVLLLEMVACDSLTVPFSPKGSADPATSRRISTRRTRLPNEAND
jgi:DNA-binding NtrC family response regulator